MERKRVIQNFQDSHRIATEHDYYYTVNHLDTHIVNGGQINDAMNVLKDQGMGGGGSFNTFMEENDKSVQKFSEILILLLMWVI